MFDIPGVGTGAVPAADAAEVGSASSSPRLFDASEESADTADAAAAGSHLWCCWRCCSGPSSFSWPD